MVISLALVILLGVILYALWPKSYVTKIELTSPPLLRASEAPTPTATAYLGIQRMWRGHVLSINQNVLLVWVAPKSGLSALETAS